MTNNVNARSALLAEVINIAEQLSTDELRVFRFQGQRMIRIGHGKYGPLDLNVDRREWSKEIAEEASDKLFYEACRDIAKADRLAERRHCERHDQAYARVKDAISSSFVIDENGCHEVVLP